MNVTNGQENNSENGKFTAFCLLFSVCDRDSHLSLPSSSIFTQSLLARALKSRIFTFNTGAFTIFAFPGPFFYILFQQLI